MEGLNSKFLVEIDPAGFKPIGRYVFWEPTEAEHEQHSYGSFEEFYAKFRPIEDPCKIWTEKTQQFLPTSASIMNSDTYLKFFSLFGDLIQLVGPLRQEFVVERRKLVGRIDDGKHLIDKVITDWVPVERSYMLFLAKMTSFERFIVETCQNLEILAVGLARIMYDDHWSKRERPWVKTAYGNLIVVLCSYRKILTYSKLPVQDYPVFTDKNLSSKFKSLKTGPTLLRDFIILKMLLNQGEYLHGMSQFYIVYYWYIPREYAPSYLLPPNINIPSMIRDAFMMGSVNEAYVEEENLEAYKKEPFEIGGLRDPMYRYPYANADLKDQEFSVFFGGHPDLYTELLRFKRVLKLIRAKIMYFLPAAKKDFKTDGNPAPYLFLPYIPHLAKKNLPNDYKAKLELPTHILHVHRLLMYAAACCPVVYFSAHTLEEETYRWTELFRIFEQYLLFALCKVTDIMMMCKVEWYIDVNNTYFPANVQELYEGDEVKDREMRLYSFVLAVLDFALETTRFMLIFPVGIPPKYRPFYCKSNSEGTPESITDDEDVRKMVKIDGTDDEYVQKIINSFKKPIGLPDDDTDLKEVYLQTTNFLVEGGRFYYVESIGQHPTDQQLQYLTKYIQDIPPDYVNITSPKKASFDLAVALDFITLACQKIKICFNGEFHEWALHRFGSKNIAFLRFVDMRWLPHVPKQLNVRLMNYEMKYVTPIYFIKNANLWLQTYAAGLIVMMFKEMWQPAEQVFHQKWLGRLYYQSCALLKIFNEFMESYDLKPYETFTVDQVPTVFKVMPYQASKYRDLSILTSFMNCIEYISQMSYFLVQNFWLIEEKYRPIYFDKSYLVIPDYTRISYEIDMNKCPDQEEMFINFTQPMVSPLWFWPRYDFYEIMDFRQLRKPTNTYETLFNAYYSMEHLKRTMDDDKGHFEMDFHVPLMDYTSPDWEWMPRVPYDNYSISENFAMETFLLRVHEYLQYCCLGLEAPASEKIDYPSQKKNWNQTFVTYYHCCLRALAAVQCTMEMLDMVWYKIADRSQFKFRNVPDFTRITSRERKTYMYTHKTAIYCTTTLEWILQRPAVFPIKNKASYLKTSQLDTLPYFLSREINIMNKLQLEP